MRPNFQSSKLKLYFPLVVLFVILVFLLPRTAKFGYGYKKGSPWNHETLITQFDFPILKTEEQVREERSRSKSLVIPYYVFRQDVVDNSIRAAGDLDLGANRSMRPSIVSVLGAIYNCGVVPDEGVKLDQKVEDPSSQVLYVHKGKRVSKKPVAEVYKESAARAKLLSELGQAHPKTNVDSVLRAVRAYDLISPNLEYDAKTTDLVKSSSSKEISTTQGFVSAGQLIVSKGEIVTSEVAQMLDSYKVEYESSMGYGGPKVFFWLGNALISLMLVVFFFLVLYFLNKGIFKETNKFLYLVFIFLVASVSALAVNKFAPGYVYMVPFTLIALYLEAFFKNKIILPICCASFLPLLVFTSNGVVVFVMFMVASVVATFAFKFFNRGWKQFINAAVVFGSLVTTYFGFHFLDLVNDNPYQTTLLLFIGSLLTVAGYPLLFLFEKMFNLVSGSRLRELSDTNNPLLRDLEHLAPGTFQHSLQVMNMVDAAARAIDADVLLARAGALYHDIGKMLNPVCFIENESLLPGGVRYHSDLTPRESAVQITGHVSDGLDLAAKHNLPGVLKDFIITHHGDSCTAYFYNKYINEGGDPGDASDFFYKGKRPSTKEQVILMICDTVEAASRTLKDYSSKTFSDFVERMVDSKMQSGQLDEADITLKELHIVKDVLKNYLSQIYHERVVYPKEKNNV